MLNAGFHLFCASQLTLCCPYREMDVCTGILKPQSVNITGKVSTITFVSLVLVLLEQWFILVVLAVT